MADSLVDIGAELPQQIGPQPQPTVTAPTLTAVSQAIADKPLPAGPMPAPKVRGDDLMAQAKAFSELSPDEQASARLFYQSKDLLSAKMDTDPKFAESALGEMGKLKGRQLTDYVVDQADKLKIEYLKKTEPELFNGPMAALNSFANTWTFGQLSKLQGLVGQFIQDRPAEDIVKEQAEKLRLLQKEYPKSNLLGEVSAFLVPGSPAKELFERAAGIGGTAVGNLLSRVTTNPGLLSKVAVAGGATATGAGAVGTTTGALGTGDQTISLDRGVENGAASALTGFVTGGAFTVAGAGISKAARGAKGLFAHTVEQTTGVPAEALRASRTNSAEIQANAGREKEIGENLKDYLLNQNRSHLPEVQQANQLLDQLPDVPAGRVISYLRAVARKNLDPRRDTDVALLNQWADRIEASLPKTAVEETAPIQSALGMTETTTRQVPITHADPNAKISASSMRNIVDQMQTAGEKFYGKDAPWAGSVLKTAARRARLEIAGMAEELAAAGAAPGASEEAQRLGKVAGTYNDLMAKAAEKRGILKFLTTKLGRNPDTMEERAQGFVTNMFGKNKDLIEARMRALDAKFDTNLVETSGFTQAAKYAQYARQIGNGGSPPILPTHMTGASLKGTVIGTAIGGVAGLVAGPGATIGAGVGAVVSSPLAGKYLLGASDKITGFVNHMAQNPVVLREVMKSPNAPAVVKQLAGQISKALENDGPISAGSVTRMVADTPYFLGLVHAYDLIHQRMQSQQRYNAVKKTQ